VRILLVEDEVGLATSLQRGLRADGYTVELAQDGLSGLSMARQCSFDVIVLDLLLPGMNGFVICRTLREEGCVIPILILTAKSGEFDEVEALDTGADDFLTKPFSYPVLLARIRALLRRDVRVRPVVLGAGDLHLDPASRSCWRGDEAIHLTPREFGLLHYLMSHCGEVVTKQEILDHVWDPEFEGNTNIVEVYVGYLRRKVDRPFGVETISTVPGGYRMDPNDD
jgi:DNA-binding response OmpR family regulator